MAVSSKQDELIDRQRAREPVAAARAETVAREIGQRCSTRGAERTFGQAARAPRVRKRIKLILQAADQWVAPWMSASACRSGCSHCCSLPSILITDAEADLIAHVSGRLKEDPGAAAISVASLVADEGKAVAEEWDAGNSYSDVPCPFLKQSMCSIYDVRPMVCRSKINADIDPLLCERAPERPASVPYLDTRPLWAASMALQLDQRLSDIRDFFPSTSSQLVDL